MQSLFEVSVKPFEPLTDADNLPERKKALAQHILLKEGNLDVIKENCKDKKFFVDVHFFLFSKTKAEGRYKKDLDNLLKVVLDVLQDKVDKTDYSAGGLGLIRNDLDIVRIHCSKSFVEKESEEGIKIALYDASQ